jgi:CRP/FNR family transcriptional regulator, cyclic AMP receptor protein
MKHIVDALTPNATKRAFKKGSILLYQGEAPRMAYIIKSGHVKVYTINNAGEEQIVTFHSANDIFPSPWLFGKTAATQYYYETFSDCEVLTLPRDILLERIHASPHAPAIIDYLATNYIGMLMRVTALEQSRAREKIMFTLYQLLFRYGTENKPGIFTIDLPLTHSVIASLVGLTRETTTAELNNLKKQKIVSYVKRTYKVHKKNLERALGEDNFHDVTL